MLASHAARIGPNAIIQTVVALRERYGVVQANDVLLKAGYANLISELPHEMIDEQQFIDLHHALLDQLGVVQTLPLMRRSGELTGQYVLNNRIPRPAALILRLLPRPLALRSLFAAIQRHAWTFVGSGEFQATPQTLSIANCVACRGLQSATPGCSYYEGAFEFLLRALIDRRIRVREVECRAGGADQCRFQIEYTSGSQRA